MVLQEELSKKSQECLKLKLDNDALTKVMAALKL